MSIANPCFPAGADYVLTRRYAQGQVFRRPAAEINQVLRACIDETAERAGVEVLALKPFAPYCQIVARDHRGRFPEFMKRLDGHLQCLNPDRGRWRSFWTPGSYCMVRMR